MLDMAPGTGRNHILNVTEHTDVAYVHAENNMMTIIIEPFSRGDTIRIMFVCTFGWLPHLATCREGPHMYSQYNLTLFRKENTAFH